MTPGSLTVAGSVWKFGEISRADAAEITPYVRVLQQPVWSYMHRLACCRVASILFRQHHQMTLLRAAQLFIADDAALVAIGAKPMTSANIAGPATAAGPT